MVHFGNLRNQIKKVPVFSTLVLILTKAFSGQESGNYFVVLQAEKNYKIHWFQVKWRLSFIAVNQSF